MNTTRTSSSHPSTRHTIRICVLGALVAALCILNVMPLGAQEITPGPLVVTPGDTITAGDEVTLRNGADEASRCLPQDGEELYIDIAIKKSYTDLYAEAYTFPAPDEDGNWEITVRIPETSYVPGVDVAGDWHVFATCSARNPDRPLFYYPIGAFEVVAGPSGGGCGCGGWTDDPVVTDPASAVKPATAVKAAPAFTG